MSGTAANAPPKRTPLCGVHETLGARMVEFGGWWMPVQYSGILQEHYCVRRRVGLFDLSHMGEIEVTGASARDSVQRIVTNDVDALEDGKALYTPMCMPSGGIVDDVILYRLAWDRYLFVVNASNMEKDLRWIREHAADPDSVADRSDALALLAVQGPASRAALERLTGRPLQDVEFMSIVSDVDVAGLRCAIARTGYTGELGYELMCDAAKAEALWHALAEAVGLHNGEPVGLGARDTLRLEARLLLYGNDIDETTTPLEAGIGWTVAFTKPDFIGSDALLRQKRSGLERRLVGFRMDGRAIARAHCGVFCDETRIGEVTSGAPSPTLGVNIGLAYVDVEHARMGRRVDIEVRGRRHPAKIVRTPFYSASKS